MDFLLGLVRVSNTTEMPEQLKDVWQDLVKHVEPLADYEKRQIDGFT